MITEAIQGDDMRTTCSFILHQCARFLLPAMASAAISVIAGDSALIDIGLAKRDITPEVPIRLAGYAGRKRPADRVDHPLWVQALALRNPSGERFVFVALDNCEVSHAFMQPVLQQISEKFGLGRGAVAVISSHTHSAPVLEVTLEDMTQPSSEDRDRIAKYSGFLRSNLVETVGQALSNFQSAILEHGVGRASFAMNRRVYRGDQVVFGDNPDGPVDWDVPVLRIKGTNGAVRAVVFGYSCHGTSVRSGDDWYVVSGEYMAYARQHIETLHPGAMAIYLTGMGADSDPSPRGQLLDAKRHGLELAGAVISILGRPMRPVRGAFRMAYDEVELPFVEPPSLEQLEKDARSEDVHVKRRAQNYRNLLSQGQPLPRSIKLPITAVRVGDDLTFLLLAGEVVVDYSRRLKRVLAPDYPWTVGYAYEVPCYIPSARIVKEGGYESDSSLIYYGFYGPFHPRLEDLLVNRMADLVAGLRRP